jgi:hypothetical protein
MREKEGTAIIHVLGTTPQDLPVTLAGAHVEIHKVDDSAADADETPARKSAAKRPALRREDCVATGTTGGDGSCTFTLGEGTYRARATFAGAHGLSDRFHICEDDTTDATAEVPLEGFTVFTSQAHCREDYTESDLCHLRYRRPTYIRFAWTSDAVKRIALVARGATVKRLGPPTGAITAASSAEREAFFAVTPTGTEVLLRAGASSTDALRLAAERDAAGVWRGSAAQSDVSEVEGDLSVSLKRSASFATDDLALWALIRRAHNAISFDRYMDFMNWIFCGEARVDVTQGALGRLQFVDGRRFLPFTDTDAYRNIKAATEAFLMANSCIIEPETNEISYIADHVAINPNQIDLPNLFNRYLGVPPDQILPYLAVIRAKLADERIKDTGLGDVVLGNPSTWPGSQGSDPVSQCYGILRDKLRCPCLLELIWSYWNEEGMLVQTMNATTRRFQNMRGPLANDPLANLEIDPLRPLNNLIWGWVQDEQHRLSVVRRNYEYDHHYGLRLAGKAVDNARTADSRSKFLEAFHTLLSTLAAFYKRDDDTTMVADGFPVLNALKEAHLILSQGAHNQFGDLPSTARIEMLMLQWILARPEFREFIPTRIMVAYPEPWMDRVDAMKKLQGWTDTSVLHFRNLAIFGEQVILGVRYGNWNSVYEPVHAVNWARYWRAQVQGYLHAYRSVTGVDLSVDVTNARIDATMPSAHLVKRLAEQRRSA